jgi:hydrogenase maturation protease
MTGVVVGVGNPTMGDDGVGRAVVRAVAAEGDDDVSASFVGTTALLALEAMDGADRAVVVDAVDAAGPPGTVHRLRLDDERSAAEVTMHDFTFAEAVRSCGAVYDLPDRIPVVGVVPERVAPGVELSDAAARAVPTAARAAAAELREPRATDTDMDATWYCADCETEIDADAIADHERRGHAVRGRLRPDRLLSKDPS